MANWGCNPTYTGCNPTYNMYVLKTFNLIFNQPCGPRGPCVVSFLGRFLVDCNGVFTRCSVVLSEVKADMLRWGKKGWGGWS